MGIHKRVVYSYFSVIDVHDLKEKIALWGLALIALAFVSLPK
jgi:hypothetical protein